RGSYARAAITKRDPRRSRGKAVSQVGCESDEPLTAWRELCAGKKLNSQFQITVIPMAFTPGVVEHVAIRQANQCQVMGLVAAKCGQTVCGSGAQLHGFGRGPESFANAVFPKLCGRRIGTRLKFEVGSKRELLCLGALP